MIPRVLKGVLGIDLLVLLREVAGDEAEVEKVVDLEGLAVRQLPPARLCRISGKSRIRRAERITTGGISGRRKLLAVVVCRAN